MCDRKNHSQRNKSFIQWPGWKEGRCCRDAAAAPLESMASTFFMYNDRALDFSYLARCNGFNLLLNGAHARLAAEVGMYHVLSKHLQRTLEPSRAALFYVPVWEYVSFKLAGMCGGNSSHGQRMRVAAEALAASPHWRRHGGRDHFVLSTAYNHPTSIVSRTFPLAKALRCSMAGRYKSFSIGYMRSAKSSWGVVSQPSENEPKRPPLDGAGSPERSPCKLTQRLRVPTSGSAPSNRRM